jgi:orotate phosphoribosyltransferase
MLKVGLMHLIPTQDEVLGVLRSSGALRAGHFVYPNGLHSSEYLQIPLAMRHYQRAKMLSVALSRLLRADPEIRALIPELSIVAPATGGLPVAYGVCEALQAKQVYWAERDDEKQAMRFRQYIEPKPGEPVIIIDDILRSGRKLSELKALLESYQARVLALAVVVYQPTPHTSDFGGLPIKYLVRLEASYYADGETCDLCRQSIPAEPVWVL